MVGPISQNLLLQFWGYLWIPCISHWDRHVLLGPLQTQMQYCFAICISNEVKAAKIYAQYIEFPLSAFG